MLGTTSAPETAPLMLEERAYLILAEARESHVVSPRDIIRMLPKHALKDPHRAYTLSQLHSWFRGLGIVVVSNELKSKIQSAVTRQKKLSKRKPRELDSDAPGYLLKLYDRDVKNYIVLDPEETKQLIARWRSEGDSEARHDAIVHNLRLPLKFSSGFNGGTLESLDLIQEGNIGLIKAVDRFDVSRQNAFSTYARWWIMQQIVRAIEDCGEVIRTPSHAHDIERKIMRVSRHFLYKLRRLPTAEELVKELGLPLSTIKDGLERLERRFVSLDERASNFENDGEDILFKDITPDRSMMAPDELFEHKEVLEKAVSMIPLVLSKLSSLTSVTDRNKEIFKTRYGLDGSYEVKTLETVGEKFSITRERVRQIGEDVWNVLEKAGIDRRVGEAVLTDDGFECVLRLRELNGEKPLKLN